jgi:hypothetical protein
MERISIALVFLNCVVSMFVEVRVWHLVTVRARPGRFSGLRTLRVCHSKSILYGALVWVRGALNRQTRRFPARAEGGG